MKRKIFKFKWLYLIVLILHSLVVFIGMMSVLNLFSRGYETSTFYFWLVIIILNIFIIISLVEKLKIVIFLINLLLIPVLIRFIWIFISNLITTENFNFYSLRIILFLLLYLFFINKFKIKYETAQEIDDIGKIE